VADITPRDVHSVRRELQTTPAVANRAVTVLTLILAEAVRDEMIASNPAIGVERMLIPARTRRVTVAEYERLYANADPLLRAVMHLCYATGQRLMDVARIRSEDIGEDGVYFKQQKTGSEVVIAWTPELRAAVAEARALKPNALRPTHLFGFAAPTYTMIRKRWEKARADAKLPDVRMHDLRAMSASDAKAQGIDPQALLGHTDERTTRIYLRDRVVPVVAGPVMKKRA
jgi:integrase